jgi:hypothetical protein
MGEHVKKMNEKVIWNPTRLELDNIWRSVEFCGEIIQIGSLNKKRAARGQRPIDGGRRSLQGRWQSRKLINFNLHTE